MHISLLLACFNRREKTCSCLQSLYEALDEHNASHEEQIQVPAHGRVAEKSNENACVIQEGSI